MNKYIAHDVRRVLKMTAFFLPYLRAEATGRVDFFEHNGNGFCRKCKEQFIGQHIRSNNTCKLVCPACGDSPITLICRKTIGKEISLMERRI